MGDNDLRKQAQQAAAQAAAIRRTQQQSSSSIPQNTVANLRPSVPTNFGLNGAVNLRGSRSLSEGADSTDGINFANEGGEAL